jgi:hypothetical protein
VLQRNLGHRSAGVVSLTRTFNSTDAHWLLMLAVEKTRGVIPFVSYRSIE